MLFACDLDLDPMTFIYRFDSYPRQKMNFLHHGFQKLPYYTQRMTLTIVLPVI